MSKAIQYANTMYMEAATIFRGGRLKGEFGGNHSAKKNLYDNRKKVN